MQLNEERAKRRRKLWFGRAVLIAVVMLFLMQNASTAQASLLDRAREFYQLPENLDNLQKEYANTKQQLEDQKNKLTDAIRTSKETEERLINQNQELQKQNAELQQRLQAMEKVALDKEKRGSRLTQIIITGIVLIVLYFVIGRLFRLSVWRRQKKRSRS
jgi:uncharacterized integral membrane protein